MGYILRNTIKGYLNSFCIFFTFEKTVFNQSMCVPDISMTGQSLRYSTTQNVITLLMQTSQANNFALTFFADNLTWSLLSFFFQSQTVCISL